MKRIYGIWTGLWISRLNDRLRTEKRDAVSSRNGFNTAEHSAIIDRSPLASQLYGIFNSLGWKRAYKTTGDFLRKFLWLEEVHSPKQNFIIIIPSYVCSRLSWSPLLYSHMWFEWCVWICADICLYLARRALKMYLETHLMCRFRHFAYWNINPGWWNFK